MSKKTKVLDPSVLFSLLSIDVTHQCRTSSQRTAWSLLRANLLKKLIPQDTSVPDDAAIAAFIECNANQLNLSISFDGDSVDSYIDRMIIHRLDKFAVTLDSNLDLYDFGPGSSVQVANNGYFGKLTDYLTYSSVAVLGCYTALVASDPRLLEIERLRFTRARRKKVSFCKLVCVPKTSKVSRLIAVEPSCNMFLQKGFGRKLEQLLHQTYGIDIRTQQLHNRKLAKRGSITREFATIDLSAASDHISLKLCEKILPPLLYETLLFMRSRNAHLPDGTTVELSMMSTMGNATTFPLQTIIFSSIVAAVYDALNIPLISGSALNSTFGVFGDDIIVKEEAYGPVIATLRRMGFKENIDKCFSGSNPFRESCGGDYAEGYNVRPAYITSLKTPHDIYSSLNRLLIWGARHNLYMLSAVGYLLSGLSDPLFVPIAEDVSCGIRTPLYLLRPKRSRSTQSFMYRSLRPNLRLYDAERDRTKIAEHNATAMFLMFLRGNITHGRLQLDFHQGRSNVVNLISSDWDREDRTSFLLEDVDTKGYLMYLTDTLESFIDQMAI